MNLKKQNKKDILLDFSLVITLFSEFGHIIQQLYSYNDYSLLSGISTKIDINRVIPLLLENICWEKNIIKKLSSHYLTKEKITDLQINKIINSKNMNNSIYYKFHSLFSIFDLLLYSSDKLNNIFKKLIENKKLDKNNTHIKNIFKTTYNKLLENFFPNDKKYKIHLLNNDYFPPLLNHIISQHSSSYYSNIINEIIAADIYNTKIKNNLSNKQFIKKLKIYFLRYYNTINPYKLIINLLKKELDINSFLSLKGIKQIKNESIFFTPKTNTSINNHRYKKYNNVNNKCVTISSDENSESESDNEEYLLTSNNRNNVNKFSEIEEYSIDDNNIVYNTNNSDTYISENSETLKRYNNIFIKN